ncbi:MAG: GNAT family N-acetyltransferase [Croceibacterium sp.]
MGDSVQIRREDHGSHGGYYADVPGTDKVAELTWTSSGTSAGTSAGTRQDVIRTADHTFVPPEARGMGLAQVLVEALVADARQQGFTIEPLCSYVAAQFRRHPEWADLRAATAG